MAKIRPWHLLNLFMVAEADGETPLPDTGAAWLPIPGEGNRSARQGAIPIDPDTREWYARQRFWIYYQVDPDVTTAPQLRVYDTTNSNVLGGPWTLGSSGLTDYWHWFRIIDEVSSDLPSGNAEPEAQYLYDDTGSTYFNYRALLWEHYDRYF